MNKTISIGGSTIHYRVEGKGKPVFLLHGFGENSSVWNDAVNELKTSFLLIVPELPGSGSSALLSDMSIEGMSRIIEPIREAEDISTFALIGHSMGGYIALAYAAAHAEKLTGLGLFHSTAYADTDEKKETRRKGITFIKEHSAAAFLKTTSPNLFSDDTTKAHPQLVESFIDNLGNFSAAALISYYEAMMARPDRTDVLKNSTIPVLFVIGEHDKAVSPEDMLKQSHIPEKAYIHTLTSSAHMGMLEEPKKANKILFQFLSDL